MKKTILRLPILLIIFHIMTAEDCSSRSEAKSSSGVTKAYVKVPTNLEGMTIEQQNIADRYKEDNKPGSIKHLYIISAMTGDVLIYSTVKGKVTSSGKRLNPEQAVPGGENASGQFVIGIDDKNWYYTNEVLGEDGTYGNSIPYIYWWDAKGVYQQQYITGGTVVHISNQPLAVKNIKLNLELNMNGNGYVSKVDSTK